MKGFILLTFAMLVFGCTPESPDNNDNNININKDNISFPGTDKIVVSYKAKMSEDTFQQSKEIVDIKVIQTWLSELNKIPKKGPGLMAKISGDASEYEINFYQGKTIQGTLRVVANNLDAPADEGYDFYGDGVDKVFVKLVQNILP